MQMQQEMMRRQMAVQWARSKDMFYWYAGFVSLATLACTAGFLKTRNPTILAPLLPLSFIVGYQADMAAGNKMERIMSELT